MKRIALNICLGLMLSVLMSGSNNSIQAMGKLFPQRHASPPPVAAPPVVVPTPAPVPPPAVTPVAGIPHGTPATGACPKGNSFADGCSAASTGSAQLPTALAGVTSRPPWNVACVDYRVGPPASQAFASPNTLVGAPGISIDSGNHTINVTANNTTISGINVAESPGWTIVVPSGISGTTITRNEFYNSTGPVLGALQFNVDSGSGTVTYNHFQQAVVAPGPNANAIFFGTGDRTVEYNIWEDSYNMAAQFAGGQSMGVVKFRYNCIHNTGIGAPAGAHGDFIQVFGGAGITQLLQDFNTVIQDKNSAQASSQGWSWTGSTPGTPIAAGSMSNNTVRITQNGTVNYVHLLILHDNQATVVNQNYVARADANFIFIDSVIDSFYPGSITCSGNVDMNGGAAPTC